MALAIRPVEALPAAQTASELLNRAWKIPAIDYSPEYMEWQLSFPAPWPLPAAMAFLDSRPVGFAAATCRRIRLGSFATHAAVVSFVCVDPETRGQGIASGLYDCLLSEIARLNCPIVTWGAPSSQGQRILVKAYERNHFAVQPLGSYAVYAGMAGRNDSLAGWTVKEGGDLSAVQIGDRNLLWGDPAPEQVQHYERDPRGRKLLVATHENSMAAAYVFRAHLRTLKGTELVTTLESVFAPRTKPEAVAVLLEAASRLWPSESPIVTATNLHGFTPESLRAFGIRQTGSGYAGYLCTRSVLPGQDLVTGTALEVI